MTMKFKRPDSIKLCTEQRDYRHGHEKKQSLATFYETGYSNNIILLKYPERNDYESE